LAWTRTSRALVGLRVKLGAQHFGHADPVRCTALLRRPRSHRPSAALSALPFLPALLGYPNAASAAVVAARTPSYRAGMSARLRPNPAVNSDAPVCAFVLSKRPWRRAGYLVR